LKTTGIFFVSGARAVSGFPATIDCKLGNFREQQSKPWGFGIPQRGTS